MPSKKDMDALVDHLVDGAESAEDLTAALRALQKRALERMLNAEMEEHLGYEKHAAEGFNGGNSRNGKGRKKVITDAGAVELEVPRDREGSFEPKVVKKGQRRLKGFDDKLISLYARGLTVRDIQAHIREIYDVEVSPDLISRVTDQVLGDVKAWQSRALDAVYPIVYFDGFVVKVRNDGSVRNRVVHIAMGINMQGKKDVLGLWMTSSEGAKFWLSVITELQQRGLEDVLVASVDGLKGFPEAIEAVWPQTVVQTCIVHMIRSSTRLVAWKNRRAMMKDLKPVYAAPTEAAALDALEVFEAKWSDRYPSVAKAWRSNWDRVRPFFEFSASIRKAVYTTNAMEAVNRQLRKATKTRGVFPTDTSVMKLLWLVIDKVSQKWTYPIKDWDLALQQLAIHFPGRVPLEEYNAP
jgi:putative transposase